MVISKSGVPIFEYPIAAENIAGVNINSVLFSGLMTAINSYSLETTGHIIGDLKFGTVQSTFSKDGFGNLYVVLTSDEIESEVLKQIHIEIKSLFLQSLTQIQVEINPEKINSIESIDANTTAIESIFNPFYRMWFKKLLIH